MTKSSNETEVEVDETRPEFTICNKTLRGNPKTIIDYLYEQGRCNCRTSKKEFARFYKHFNKNCDANSYLTILKLYLIYLEPKCICMNDLSKQSKTGENETVMGNEILCVQGGFLQQRGKCNANEYCRGTTHLHEAECGTESLCKKGTTRIR